jgi:hypothetical protein
VGNVIWERTCTVGGMHNFLWLVRLMRLLGRDNTWEIVWTEILAEKVFLSMTRAEIHF